MHCLLGTDFSCMYVLCMCYVVTQASVQNKENLNAAASRSSTEATGTSHSESTSNKTSGTSNIISNDIVNSSVTNISDGKVPDSPLHEFISDTFTASKQDLLEVEQNMKKLGITDDAQSRSAKNGLYTVNFFYIFFYLFIFSHLFTEKSFLSIILSFPLNILTILQVVNIHLFYLNNLQY